VEGRKRVGRKGGKFGSWVDIFYFLRKGVGREVSRKDPEVRVENYKLVLKTNQ